MVLMCVSRHARYNIYIRQILMLFFLVQDALIDFTNCSVIGIKAAYVHVYLMQIGDLF